MNGRTGRGRTGSLARWLPGLTPVVVALASAGVIVGPGLAPGYLLVRDMVFVPSPPLTARLLGLGQENPRAVPSDLVVALLSHVLPGDIVQKVVLLAILVAAGVGAARLAPRGALSGSAAALVALWNPYVGERLAMGQWALLVGYAALPWVVRGCVDLAHGSTSGRRSLTLALVLGSLGGAVAWLVLALGVLAALVGVAVADGSPGRVLRRSGGVLGFGVLLALPWAVPALLRPHQLASDPAGFDVFGARADTPWGVVVSVLTGGGTWNAEVVPPGRDTVVGAAGALALLAWALTGYLLTRRTGGEDRPAESAYRPAVVAMGAAGLAVSLASAWPGVVSPLAQVPGGGLLRDGSRQLALWVLFLAVGAGWAAHWLRGRRVPSLTPWLAALLPVAVLPSLGWGLAGLLQPVGLPADVRVAAQALGAAPPLGAVVVLPFHTYRRYPWNHGRASLTPWPRLVDRRVVAASDLTVTRPGGAVTVAGEDEYAVRVGQALGSTDPAAALAALGVGWLVVDVAGTPVPLGTTLVLSRPDASLYRVDEAIAGPVDPAAAAEYDPPVLPVVLGDGAWLAAVGAALLVAARRRSWAASVSTGPTFR